MGKKLLGMLLSLCLAALPALGETTPQYQSGTYTATSSGYGGEVSVTLTFDVKNITDVSITGIKETEGIGSVAITKLSDTILSEQRVDVDTVAGATFTSKAVLSAAKACMEQATGTAHELTVHMLPGVYEGRGVGFRISEPVSVSVTISEDAIISIEVDQQNISDTKAFVQTVVDTFIPRVIEHQSLAVDATSGATATSNAVRQAVEEAVVKALLAGGSEAEAVSAFYRPLQRNAETEEIITDVVVVGLGGAGLAAAISASEQGLSVLAIDKAAKWGGNSVLTSGPMAINVPSQVEAEISEWTDPAAKEVITKKTGAPLIDQEALYQAWLDYTTVDGVQHAKPEMIRLMMDESGYTDDWLAGYGFSFDAARGFAGNVWAAFTPLSGGKSLSESYFAKAMDQFQTKLGGKYMLETEAYDLLTDDTGAVTGIKARNVVSGKEWIINAKAVVLATGGFAGSGRLMEKYLENHYFPLKGEWKLFGMHQNDGKMIEAAIEKGAGTFNISVAPMVHMAGSDGFLPGFETVPVEGATGWATGRPAVWSVGDIPMNMAISPDTLAVGANAQRFTSETMLSMFNPWMAGPHFYSVWGSEQLAQVVADGFMEVPAGPATSYLGYGTSIPAGVPMDQAEKVLEEAIKAGYVYKANTIAELADKMGLPASDLEATVQRYNESCESGVDSEFGKDAKYLKPVTGAPYYGIVGSSYCYSTCGGLDVNTNFQVLKTDGVTPITGLFAVGTDSIGVLFSEAKAYVTYGGAAMGWAFTSGRLVGQHIAESIR